MTFDQVKIVSKQTCFTTQEKRNIIIYIFGIMLYKFGVEAFNGAMIALATNRYDQDAHDSVTSTRTFEKVGLLIGLNQAFQCFGSILIGSLMKHCRAQIILSTTIFIFACSTAILMIVDVTTGGYMKPKDFQPLHKSDFRYYGKYRTDFIIPIYCICGVTFGMVESIRRVIPANIAGDNIVKLRKMNALVHIFYEVSGVGGALTTALVLIPRLGNNYAFIITPILFTLSGLIFIFIRSIHGKIVEIDDNFVSSFVKSKRFHIKSIITTFLVFIQSIYVGAKIVFTDRKFIWLFSVYPLAMYSHRYLENSIAPQVARRYLYNSNWSQIIVGGSNLGELLGALFVFCFNDLMKGPALWVRLDGLMLLISWYIPFYYPQYNEIKYAWIIAATFIPMGFGSAVGDISLDAYIQSSLTRLESKHKNVSPLGAVMSFLYSIYIIIYSTANPLLGRHLDYVYNTNGTIQSALVYTAAVQLTIIFIVMFISTFIPKNAFAFNPTLFDDDSINTKEDEILGMMPKQNGNSVSLEKQ